MKTKKVIYISLGTLFLILLGFFLIGIFYENPGFEFSFYVNETGEVLNGEIFINNISWGYTENGKITLPKENLSISEFTFKTKYNLEEFSFDYEFYQDYLSYGYMEFIVIEEQLKPKKIYLIFYENKSDCFMEGKIYVDDVLLGETKKGKYELSEKEYKAKFKANFTLYINGLTDSCFGDNKNLPLAEYWIVPDLEYYFYYNENVSFETSRNPRRPRYYAEMQGFIMPEEVKGYFESDLRKYITNKTEDDLDSISNYRMNYRDDLLLFKEGDYWQTPLETIKKGHGDCEDWAVTTLSLIRAYNDSIRCFNAIWQTHISIFCYFNNNFIIYDQGRVKFKTSLDVLNTQDYLTKQENRVRIRKMRNDYLDAYGILPGEDKLFAVFNERELVIFEEDEDFVDWALNLIRE